MQTDSVGVGYDMIFFVSSELPADANVAAPRTTL